MSRILVIDDDKFVRTSIRAVLESAGHEVSDAGDADSGIDKQRATPFDIAIVDLVMPQKEGLETIRELRMDFPDLAIIAISGGGAIVKKNFVEAAELFGASTTLEKPFGGEELLNAVINVMSVSRHVSNQRLNVARA
ncbi:response regulator [Magnetovibrio sp.]|uniref:response regulator n=1 Tax=Magnetovibrio sp. TaxID=2024836 RepID=UPI002F921294